MSYNAWNYTNSNSVNYTDRTGRFFEETAIPKDAQYSCNCGWLNRTHIQSFGKSLTLLDNLKHARDGYRPDPRLSDKWVFYYSMNVSPPEVLQHRVSVDLFNGFAMVPNRSLSSGDNIPKLAVSIFMDANEQFEEGQGAWSGVLLKLDWWAPGHPLSGKLRNSYFSEEDLPSDIIGFEAALEQFNRGGSFPTFDELKEQIRQVCGAVGEENSRRVFEDTYQHGALALTGWRNWYPRLVPLPGGCTSGLCSGRRAWPAKYTALTSLRIRPEENGMWWWWYLQEEGVLVPTDRQEVFRLSAPK